MTEYRDVLERELERLSPPRIPIERLARRRDRIRRNHRIGAAIVGIAVALVVLGGAIRALDEGQGTGNPSPPVQPTSEPSDLSLVDVATGRTRPVPNPISTLPEAGGFEVSPDGSTLAFDARVAPEGVHQIFVARADGSEVRQVTSDDRVDARNPSWSPDGTEIVYEGRMEVDDGRTEDDLFVLEVATGAIRRLHLRLAPIPHFDMHTPSFGPSGSTIVYTDFDPERVSVDLRSVQVDGGESMTLVPEAAFGSPSPDRRTIAYRKALTIPGIGSAVTLVTIDGRRRLPSASDIDQGVMLGALGNTGWVDAGTASSWSPDGRRVAYTDAGANLPPRRFYVFDLDTQEVTVLGRGAEVAWLDDSTLIVRHFQPREEQR